MDLLQALRDMNQQAANRLEAALSQPGMEALIEGHWAEKDALHKADVDGGSLRSLSLSVAWCEQWVWNLDRAKLPRQRPGPLFRTQLGAWCPV